MTPSELEPGLLSDYAREIDRESLYESNERLTDAADLHQVIPELPPEAFRPPSFLKKTAPPDLRGELTQLFEELYQVHTRHLGDGYFQTLLFYFSVTVLWSPERADKHGQHEHRARH